MARRIVAVKQTRVELPPYRMTWREGVETKRLEVGARCYDAAWPWWRPNQEWRNPHERSTVD
jgi:hypothetical protein